MIPRHPWLYHSLDLSMGLPLGNAGLSALLLTAIIVVLIRYNHCFNAAERLGYGLAGASAFMSIFKQLGFAALMLPFNDWYQLLWRTGWLFVVCGKIWRMEKHSRANKAAVRQAQRHFADRCNP